MQKKHLIPIITAACVILAGSSPAQELKTLWQIGKSDNSTADLKYGPGSYRNYRPPAPFIIGKSTASEDWPYVLPGDLDKWATATPQTFNVVFGIAHKTSQSSLLVLDFVDTHSIRPPRLRITLNGKSWEYQPPKGAGDASLNGHPAQGKEYLIKIKIPSNTLKEGDNKLSISNISGSWVLWDSLHLDSPPATRSAPVSKATVAAIMEEQKKARKKNPNWPELEEVVVVFKTHFDIGYNDLVANIIKRYQTRFMDGALNVMQQTANSLNGQKFMWTMPGWPMKVVLGEGQTSARRARIEKAIRDGYFVWHALPFTWETESLGLEEIIRGMSFSSRLSRKYSKPLPRAAKQTDVPSQSWILPTLLKHSGIEFLHIGCNSASASPVLPQLFKWEGPDGSQLLTFYSVNYGTGIIPPRGWPHKTWLAMIMTDDNSGPPSVAAVQHLLAQANRELPGVKITFGRLSDFADAIIKENPKLPVIRKDMPDTWIHGCMTLPEAVKTIRHARPALYSLEMLDTLLNCKGVPTNPIDGLLDKAYENSILFGEHTWGLAGRFAGFPCLYGDAWKKAMAEGKRYARHEKSYTDHAAYAYNTAKIAEPALKERLNKLAENIAITGPRVVIFNSLPRNREKAVVEIEGLPASVSALRDLTTKKLLPVSRLNGKSTVIAENLPAAGYKTYTPVNRESIAKTEKTEVGQNAVIENKFLKITLDAKRAGISSVIDKQTGRELVDSSKYALGQFLFEQFDADDVKFYTDHYLKTRPQWAYNCMGKRDMPGTDKFRHRNSLSKNAAVTVAADRLQTVADFKIPTGDGMRDKTELKVTLYRDCPFFDIEWSIKDKTPDPMPEAGWICLPFKFKQPAFKLGRLGAVTDPAKDFIKGAERYMQYLATGMMIRENNGRGVGICPVDAPIVSIDQTGCWKYSRDFVPKKPTVFVNLFNNQWSTNYRMWQDGSWSVKVRIWALAENDTTESGLITPALNARNNCYAAYADGKKGSLPLSLTGLQLSRKGIQVTDFGPNPDGGGTILRLWEQAGQSGTCTVTLPDGIKCGSLQPVNLRGELIGKPIAVKNGKFSFDLPAYSPAAFVIKQPHQQQ